jgi:hypothetical protein
MGLGSGIRDPGSRIPDLGVKKAPDPGSGSATLIICMFCKNSLIGSRLQALKGPVLSLVYGFA